MSLTGKRDPETTGTSISLTLWNSILDHFSRPNSIFSSSLAPAQTSVKESQCRTFETTSLLESNPPVHHIKPLNFALKLTQLIQLLSHNPISIYTPATNCRLGFTYADVLHLIGLYYYYHYLYGSIIFNTLQNSFILLALSLHLIPSVWLSLYDCISIAHFLCFVHFPCFWNIINNQGCQL